MICRPQIAPELPVLAPAWCERRPANASDAAFAAGAALAALEQAARAHAPWGGVWRKRLALNAAAASARVDAAALRDALALTRPCDDPGPSGRLLVAWRALASRPTRLWPQAFAAAAAAVAMRAGQAEDLLAAAQQAALATEAPIAAAAAAAAAALRLRPEAAALALWLADATLAERLKWPFPLPLLAAHVRPPRTGEGDWLMTCCAGYAAAAADACRLALDLARRAHRLQEAAPSLRAKGAPTAIAALLDEDALTCASRIGGMAARPTRRLFERMVELGALRELSGRESFRLYGL